MYKTRSLFDTGIAAAGSLLENARIRQKTAAVDVLFACLMRAEEVKE